MSIRFRRFLARVTCTAGWFFLAACVPELVAGTPQTGAYIREDNAYVYAGNDRVELTFQKSDGRLYALVDKISQLDFLAKKNAYWGPFTFPVNLTGTNEYLHGCDADQFTYAAATDTNGPVLTLTWAQFRSSRPAPLDIQIQIAVHIPAAGGLTYWTIALTNNEVLILPEVEFPDLEGIPQLSVDGAHDEFTHPAMTGLLFQDPANNLNLSDSFGGGLMYPSAFAPMQFVTYSSRESNSGLYMATQDSDGYTKFFVLARPGQDWMNLQVTNRLPLTPATNFTPPFDVAVGVFTGDWYDAAQIYKTWALQQPWAAAAVMPNSSQATGWFPQLPLHETVYTYPICYDMNHFSIVPAVSQNTAGFMGQPDAIDWIGWENRGWYVYYPDVFPPKEGWTSFDNAVSQTHAAGNRIWVAPNTASYSNVLPGWATDSAGAASGDNGAFLSTSAYSDCTASTTFVTMCPGSAIWQQTLQSLLTTLASHQVDIIELDGFPSFPLPCTNPAHNHPPGWGNWWYHSYRDIFTAIKSIARQSNPGVIFSAEGLAEVYLGFLDSVWDPWTTGWPPSALSASFSNIGEVQRIPMWHAVYHERTPIQGATAFVSQNAYGNWRDFYLFGFAQAFVWGEVPATWYADEMLTNLKDPGELAMAAFLKRIVGARSTYASPFLVNGRLLRNPAIQVPTFLNPGATSIPYTGANYPPFETPSILGSLWQDPNGDAGYVFANVSHDPVTFSLSIDAVSTLLPPQGQYGISLVRNGISSLVATAASLPVNVSVSLDPADVVFIPVVPAGASMASQAITFGALTDLVLGAEPFSVSATASSGLAVSFVSTTPKVCTVAGVTVTIVAIGACAIQATQSGNVSYLAATPVTESFQVMPESQTITFQPLSNALLAMASLTISATASSNLAVSFASTTTAVCTVSGTTVTLVADGTCTIQATQAGDNNWATAPTVTRTFQVTGTFCDVSQDASTSVADVQRVVGEALGVIPAVNNLSGDGMVTVVDVQIVVNAALGLACIAQ